MALLEPISRASTLWTSSTGVRGIPVSHRQQAELQTLQPREDGVQGHARAVKVEAARAGSPPLEGRGVELRGASEVEVQASVQSQAGTDREQATEVPRQRGPHASLLNRVESSQGLRPLLHPLGDRGTGLLARGGPTTAGEATVEERDATTFRAEDATTIDGETMEPEAEHRTAPAARAGTASGEVRTLGPEGEHSLFEARASDGARTEAGEDGELRALGQDRRRAGQRFVGQGGLRQQWCWCLGRSNGQQQRGP